MNKIALVSALTIGVLSASGYILYNQSSHQNTQDNAIISTTPVDLSNFDQTTDALAELNLVDASTKELEGHPESSKLEIKKLESEIIINGRPSAEHLAEAKEGDNVKEVMKKLASYEDHDAMETYHHMMGVAMTQQMYVKDLFESEEKYIEFVKHALGENPENSELIEHARDAFHSTNNTKQGIEFFEQQDAQYPSVNNKVALGQLNFADQNMHGAEQALRTAYKESPSDQTAYELGNFYQNSRQHYAAEYYYKDYLDNNSNPDSNYETTIRINYVSTLVKTKKLTTAQNTLDNFKAEGGLTEVQITNLQNQIDQQQESGPLASN